MKTCDGNVGKVMDLNETQTSVLSLIFKYGDDNQLPLLDLADLRTTLQFLTSDDGKATLADYGGMSTQTVGVLLRAIVNLEEAGADVFFGEPEFGVNDLIRATPDGVRWGPVKWAGLGGGWASPVGSLSFYP